MKNPFNKADLPMIDRAVHSASAHDDQVNLYYKIRVEDGFVRHISTEVILLERAALAGHGFAIWELAQHYYYDDSVNSLPLALRWWKRANLLKNEAAIRIYRDYRHEIISKIQKYSEGLSEYSDIELRVAMLSEIYLFELGTVDWQALSDRDRMDRINTLTEVLKPILGVHVTYVSDVPGLTYTYPDGSVGPAYGLANQDYHIDICREILWDKEKTLAVLIHELGHYVCHRASYDTEYAKIYGITKDRVESWGRGDVHNGLTTSEEDPDTLSYGVYTNWAILFADQK